MEDNNEKTPIEQTPNKEPAKNKDITIKLSKRGLLFVIIALAVIAGGIYAAFTIDFNKTPTGAVTANETVENPVIVDLYVMSQCPYGVQAENIMPEVKEKLGSAVDINIEYIGAEANGEFKSLHGQPEIDGNIIQLCVKEMAPEKMLDFIVCQNKNNPTDLTKSIDKCAEKTGLDAAKIKECFNGKQGKELLRTSFAKAQEAKAQASPTIFVDGKPYQSQRDAASITRAVCNSIKENISACKDLPACESDVDCTAEPKKIGSCINPGEKDAKCEYTDPVKVEVVVLNDKTCKNCDVTQAKKLLGQMFLGAEIREVDYADDPELFEKNNVDKVPAFLFGTEIENTKAWKESPNAKQAFVKTDFGYKLREEATGANHWINEEAKKEWLDSVGVVLGDNKPQIDFFVMSYCPYGNQAEEAIAPVFEKLDGLADFNPHYVIYQNYQGGGEKFCYDEESKYCSMHGVQELNQGVREYIVWQEYGEAKMFEFMLAMNEKCTYKNADKCWEDVAEDLEIDVEKIETAFEAGAMEILAEESKLNKAYGATGSPAVFIDGEPYNGQRTPQAYMTAICSKFENAPAACDEIDTLPSAGPTSQGTC